MAMMTRAEFFWFIAALGFAIVGGSFIYGHGPDVWRVGAYVLIFGLAGRLLEILRT